MTSPGLRSPSFATACHAMLGLRPHSELAATWIDEVKPPAAGKFVTLGDRRAGRADRALARHQIVGVHDHERTTCNRRRLDETQSASEPRALNVGVVRAVVFEAPPERRRVERLRPAHVEHRNLEEVDGVMSGHRARTYHSACSPSGVRPYVFIFV